MEFNKEIQAIDLELNQIINDYNAITIDTNSAIKPFKLFNLFDIPDFEEIPAKLDVIEEDKIFQVQLPLPSVRKLKIQFKEFLIHSLMYTEIVNSRDEVISILDRLVTDETLNENPDNMKEFKPYTITTGNTVKSMFEFIKHPISIVSTLFAAVPAELFVRPFTKKGSASENKIIKLEEYTLQGTLAWKIRTYQLYLKSYLISYAKVAKIAGVGSCCSFNLVNNSYTGIEGIAKIIPQDSLGIIVDTIQRMSEILGESPDRNSYEVFQSISTIYRQFVSECTQRNIFSQGLEAYHQYFTGGDFVAILSHLQNNVFSPTEVNRETRVVNSAKIFAFTIMRIALAGRGIDSNSQFIFYGIRSYPNSINTDKSILVFENSKIKAMYPEIRRKIKILISSDDNSPKDFEEDKFEETIRAYKMAINEDYQKCKTEFYNKIKNIKNEFMKRNVVGISQTTTDITQTSTGNTAVTEFQVKNSGDAFDIGISGILFKVNLSDAAELANQIRECTISYNMMNESKKKVDQLKQMDQLISFYKQTQDLLNDQTVHGIIITIHEGESLVIDPIHLDVPQ